MNLAESDARIRVRTRQSGGHALHVLIKLPDEWWYVSDQAIPSTDDWTETELRIADLTWQRFNVITIDRMQGEGPSSLERVEEIGLTDLRVGGGSKACSRIDWLEVWGDRHEHPVRQPPVVKSSPVKQELPANVREKLGVVYAAYGEREMKVDLYMPAERRTASPAIVFIHGGGWYKGSPSSYTPMAQQLASRGFVTANIEYRLSGEAPFPAALHDCKAAVRWLRANAEAYQIDPQRIGCVGGSAGGHLSGLLATSGGVSHLEGDGGSDNQPSNVQAAVVMAGSMDLTDAATLASARQDPRQRMVTFMGGDWETAQRNYIDASPLTHLGQGDPPFLMIDGEFDRPEERYGEFSRRLKQLGISYEFKMIKDGPHPFWSRQPFFDPALDHVEDFFTRTLK